MQIDSNLYANRIFSEHPIGLWSLDDDVSYLSLISNEKRSLVNWNQFVNASAVSGSVLPDAPFPNEEFSTLRGNNFELPFEAYSGTIFNINDISKEQDNFNISFFVNTNCTDVDYYEFGYRYLDPFTGQFIEDIVKVVDKRFNIWIRLSGTFDPPSKNAAAELVFRAYANDGSVNYDFTINGLSVGQWAEPFSQESLGAFSASAPLGYEGVAAVEYGVQESSGYYLSENKRLLAVNEGIPLIYGSKNLTRIIASASANPSIIFPSLGFLNESGKHKEFTIEFWMRINPDTVESRRIFGPTGTNEGLYVRDGVLSLALGSQVRSHPISEWYRPMLVQILIKENDAAMLINGEQVFEMPFDKNSIVFDTEDWVGFYSYSDIDRFEIDCFSVYSYPISLPASKRRFVWGQGTDSPQNISDAFKGKNAYINFSNAQYTKNKSYPDTNFWFAGYKDNLSATRTSLSSPNYQLPEIFIESKTINELYQDNKIVNELEDEEFFTFRPNVENGIYDPDGIKWSEPGYLLFPSLNFIDRLSSFYGVFSVKTPLSFHPLITLVNQNTSDQLVIYLENGEIKYKFNDTVLYSENLEASPIFAYDDYGYGFSYYEQFSFAVGLNLNQFAQQYGYAIAQFFKSTNILQMYVGGDGTNTFSGKIYCIGFSDRKNYQEIKNSFLEEGIVDRFEYEDLLNHYATYTLTPINRFNRFFLDISISGEWQEYFPLASLAGVARDQYGRRFYEIDYLQLNVGYPSVTERVATVIENLGWTYQELKNEYQVPVQKSYEVLDNAIITGYRDYDDLKNNNIIEYFLNTEQSSLRAYITFQLLFDGANRPLPRFPYEKSIIDCCFIDAPAENTTEEPFRAYQTKFEFIDNVVVFPPKNIDFKKVAMVVHFNVKQKGILSNPVKVRDLEIASRALNTNQSNEISTESGLKIFPYVKSGLYLDNKEQNPVLIGKRRNPYLHLTNSSGIKLLGRQTFEKEFGLAIPINEEQASKLSIGSFQIWTKYDLPQFPGVPFPIFEIESRGRIIEFIVRSDSSGKRGFISARNKQTKINEDRIVFHQNGVRVKNPYVEINQWNAIGIKFDDPLVFDDFIGYLNLFRGMTFNNIAYYDASGLGERIATSSRIWLRVLTEDGEGNFTWAYWEVDADTDIPRIWRNLAVIEERRVFDLTQKDIYNAFAGTNRIVVDDGTSLSVDSDSLAVLSEAFWSRFSGKPA
jgi:hypothetical protein